MQIACEVRRVLNKHPNQVKLEEFKLPFKFNTDPVEPTTENTTKDQVAEFAMAAWMARVNVPADPKLRPAKK